MRQQNSLTKSLLSIVFLSFSNFLFPNVPAHTRFALPCPPMFFFSHVKTSNLHPMHGPQFPDHEQGHAPAYGLSPPLISDIFLFLRSLLL